ncbi:RecT family recombinase [Paenibacillus crassostreae]|uniref:RecT protein n=1 Tax=Paenibacillus crassostreae TaxID=1763538 RepID=A0A167C640_9BACL|nr:RecT family recombinase [Paenibacillus crassostreae]AOZ91600.1 RecT protein [Paenibacillus crassostreae]OAB72825.1 RecT protein [Paenibacillus crassostreae]
MTKTNTQIQAINEEVVVGNFTQKHLDTLKSTIAKGTSNEQFSLFMQTCVRTGLDPFLNQIFCIVYNGKDGPVMSMQIAVEGIVALAKKHEQYKGFIASEVKEEDEFEIDMVTGEPKHRIVSMQRGKTVGAYCVAYRENAPNIAVIITSDQVDHLVKGRNGQMWKDYFDDMIVKHAIKRAFKRQYGIEVSEDEFGSNNQNSSPAPYERREVGPEVEVIDVSQQDDNTDQRPAEPIAPLTESQRVNGQITEALEKLGVTTPDGRLSYMLKNIKDLKEGTMPTLGQKKGLLKIIEMEIQQKQSNSDDELPL